MLGCNIPQPIIHIHKVTNLVSHIGRTSRFYKDSDANASYIRPWYLHMALVAQCIATMALPSLNLSSVSIVFNVSQWARCMLWYTFMHSDFMNINSLSS